MRYVKAIAKGYYGDIIREEGDVFQVTDTAKGRWFVDCDADGKEVKAPAVKKGKKGKADEAEVDTLSEMTRRKVASDNAILDSKSSEE